jgi:ABC-type polysaccharide/polyol phosphate transport system ATPase subunit
MIDAGTTVLLVSHQLKQVEDLATRAMWLDHGNVKMFGDASEVVDAYTEHVKATREQN